MDSTFHRDLKMLRTLHGGIGFRPTKRRALSLNAMVSAIPLMMGTENTPPLWPSLGKVLHADSLKG